MIWTIKREEIKFHPAIGGGSALLWCVRDDQNENVAADPDKERAIKKAKQKAIDRWIEIEIKEVSE